MNAGKQIKFEYKSLSEIGKFVWFWDETNEKKEGFIYKNHDKIKPGIIYDGIIEKTTNNTYFDIILNP